MYKNHMHGLSQKKTKNVYRGGSTPVLTNCGKGRCPANARLIRKLHYELNRQYYIDRAKAQPIEQKRAIKKRWKDNNRAWVAANTAARKKHIKLATPKWLTRDQKHQIRSFYEEADRLKTETGVDYEVDHIVPVRGENVCGLHVPWNLRVITAEENQLKNRKLLEDIIS